MIEYKEMYPDLESMLDTHDGCLLIGDRALESAKSNQCKDGFRQGGKKQIIPNGFGCLRQEGTLTSMQSKMLTMHSYLILKNSKTQNQSDQT